MKDNIRVIKSQRRIGLDIKNSQPHFQLTRNGELICEMTTSVTMERQVEQTFNTLASYLKQESGYQDLIKEFQELYTLIIEGKIDEAAEHIEDAFKLNENWEK